MVRLGELCVRQLRFAPLDIVFNILLFSLVKVLRYLQVCRSAHDYSYNRQTDKEMKEGRKGLQ